MSLKKSSEGVNISLADTTVMGRVERNGMTFNVIFSGLIRQILRIVENRSFCGLRAGSVTEIGIFIHV